jgi:hypothetical protein
MVFGAELERRLVSNPCRGIRGEALTPQPNTPIPQLGVTKLGADVIGSASAPSETAERKGRRRHGMTHQEETAADRLRRALLAFKAAQALLLTAERKLKGLPVEEVEAFWAAPGRRIERQVATAATQVIEAFAAFSAAGQVASAEDRHLVTEAKRVLAEGNA